MRRLFEHLNQIRIVLVVLLLLLIYGPAFAATTATATPGPWNLYRGTSIIAPRTDYASQDACIAAAKALNVERAYTCRTSTTVAVAIVADPVSCAVSTWSETPSTWSACTAGSRSRSIVRTRTVTTQPANGGAACPVLMETRTESEACAVAPPAPGVTGAYEQGPTRSVTLTGVHARWPGYSAATAGPIGNVSGGTAYANDPRTIGTRDGLYRVGIGNGFTFTVQGDATPRTIKVYAGGWNGAGKLTAGVYTHTTAEKSGSWDALYTLTFTGNLTVSWTLASGTGNVTIQAAALAGDATPVPPPTGVATLKWAAPTENTDGSSLANLAGFRVYHGLSASDLVQAAQLPGAGSNTYAFEQLASGTHYFAVTAYTNAGAESVLSTVGTKTIP